MVVNLAVVTHVLPDRHGVMVAFRNGNHFPDGSNPDHPFVRVLESRAHRRGGATVNLPEVGELGLVLTVDPGLAVWLGSLPFEELNQMDPREGLAGWRHSSGVEVIVLENGDTQFVHPTGLWLSITRSGEGLPMMQGTMAWDQVTRADATPNPVVRLFHPSGADLKLDQDGKLSFTTPTSITVEAAGDATIRVGGNLVANVKGESTLTLEGAVTLEAKDNVTATIEGDLKAEVKGDAAITVTGTATLKAATIVLDGPVECTSTLKVAREATISGKAFTGHIHTSASPGSPTSPPIA